MISCEVEARLEVTHPNFFKSAGNVGSRGRSCLRKTNMSIVDAAGTFAKSRKDE
jgi:hypothetical protein